MKPQTALTVVVGLLATVFAVFHVLTRGLLPGVARTMGLLATACYLPFAALVLHRFRRLIR